MFLVCKLNFCSYFREVSLLLSKAMFLEIGYCWNHLGPGGRGAFPEFGHLGCTLYKFNQDFWGWGSTHPGFLNPLSLPCRVISTCSQA